MGSEIERVEHALASADKLSQVRDELRKVAGPCDEDPIWSSIAAFSYQYVSPARSQEHGIQGPYATLFQYADGVYPERLPEVTETVLDEWNSTAAHITHPAGLARLNDLLWERHHRPRPDLHARAAIAAYLALSEISAWWDIERALTGP
jgi:hypothetical protein